MSSQITLPRLVGTREAANVLLSESELSDDLRNSPVLVLSRALSTATSSFADELLRRLQERNASEIVLVGAPAEFVGFMKRAAQRRAYVGVRVATAEDV